MENERTPQADKVRKAWQNAEDAYTDIVSRSERYMRYVLNDPYSATEKSKAQKKKKPLLRYNIMIVYLAIIIGNEQLSRRRALIKTRSANPRMVDMVEAVQGRWNAINDEENVEEKIQTAFSDGLIMPVGGYIVRSFKMDKQGYLDFHYEVANNMRVKVDPETKASDAKLEKCRWLIKEGWERPEYLMDKFNIAQEDFDELSNQKWYERISLYIKRFKESGFSSSSDYDKENDLYRILEMQERTQTRFIRVYDENGLREVTPEMFKKLKVLNPDIEYLGEVEGEIIHITTIIPALNDYLVVDRDNDVPSRNFDIFRVGSYSFTNQITESESLVGLLRDPQDDINKGKSQNRDLLGQILAGATIVRGRQETEAYERLKKYGGQPNLVVQTKNPNAKIDRLGPGNVPPELLYNTQDSMMHGDKIAQLPAAMQGRSERSGESGKLFEQKVDRAAAAINPYYKNVSKMRKAIVEDFVDNFHYVYSEYDRPVQVKTKDENGKDVWSEIFLNLRMATGIINDTQNLSLYVELDEGEDNITAREENFNKLMAIVEVVSRVNPALVDVLTILRNAPIQDVDKWIDYVKAVLEGQAEEAANQKQIEEQKARVEIAKDSSDITSDTTVAQA